MSSGGSGSSKPSWKNSKGGSGSSKKQSGPSWKRERDTARASDRPRSKAGRLIRYGLAFVGCFGAIVWLILQLFQPNPAHVSLIGTDYAQTLAIPANVQGLNVLRSIKQLGGQDTGVLLWSSKRLNVPRPICDLSDDKGWLDAWKTELRDMQAGLKEKTLLVVLSLHGAVDPVSGPYFLVGSSASDTNRLPLTDVIAAFKDVPKNKDVVLVLDAAQVDTNWTLGIVSNDFARKLVELKAKIEEVPNLWVLASCDADQHSWRSRDGRTSIFGQAFEAALKGAGTGDSGRVNLGNLFDYVKKEVERQASESWGATQTPILISKKDPKAAAQVQINVVAKEKERPDATVPPQASALDPQLEARWKKYEELSRESPPPTVYAPYHWRAYREAVVRYEELTRAEYPSRPQRLEALLDDLEKRMETLQPIKLDAAGLFTLAMPGVSGRSIPAPKASWQSDFTKLWNAAGSPDLAKAWETVLKSDGQTDETLLKIRLYDDLLEKVIASPNDMTTSIAKIRAFVQEIPPRPVPAEVHFASMLAQWVPTTALSSPDYAGLFARVVGVRRQAERVAVAATEAGYGYGERVLPWIAPTLNEADTARRQGEDLLFSSESKDWFRAAELLTDAAAKYDKAAARAEIVRKALVTRDRAFADLPFYSRWAVDRVSSVDTAATSSVDLATRTEALWGKVYELAALLDREPDASVTFAPQAAVDAGLAELEKAYITDMGDLTGVGGTGLPRDWDLDRALAVPSLRIANRATLSSPRRSGGGGSRPVNLAARNAQARLQARMAIAAIGPWFDGQTDARDKSNLENDLEKSESVIARVETALSAESKLEPAKRAEAVTWIGDQIGRRFRIMPAQIDRLAEGVSELDVREGLRKVQTAERLERIVPGASSPVRTPTSDNRRRFVHDLLIAQANRTWTDHWYAAASAGEPFYVTAGDAYLNAAGAIIKNSPAVAEAKKRLAKPGSLVFDEPPSIALTSEASLPLRYSVQPSEGAEVPPGFPVAWIEPGKNLQVVPAATDQQFRRVIGFGEKPEPVVLRIGSPLIPKLKDKASNLAKVDPSSVTVKGFYRGQNIVRTTPVGIYPVPEVTQIKDASPVSGTVTVRADDGVIQQFGEGSGALAIVLDCSGSMWAQDVLDIKDSRYRKATKALRAVLSEVPAGTKVSVWVFGEKSFNGVEFKNTRESIQQLQPMTVWDPAMTGPLVDRAEQLEPRFYTPLVRTMIKARDDLFTSQRALRTLLVLSDGADEPEKDLKFPDDVEFNPDRAQIENFLPAAFANTHIRINMVFFQTEAAQLDAVRRNFGVVQGFDPPGFIATADNLDALIQNLKRGSDQKITYRVLRENNQRVKPGDDKTLVSSSPDSDQWHIPALDPGVDKIQVETDRTIEQRFSIDNGDRLLIRLGVQPEGGLGFRRGLWSEDLQGRPVSTPDQGNGWRMTLVQNQAKRGGGLSLLTAFERVTDVFKIPIQQPKPFDFWVELQVPKGAETPRGVVWNNLDGYPAPSWAFDALTWPVDAKKVPVKPVLEAWWSSDKEVVADAAFEKVKDFDGPLDDSLRGLSGRTVSIDGRTVTIESFTVEDTKLVVRISHAVGFPVILRLDGMAPTHQEHRYYSAAGKYTAIFSDTNRDEVQTKLTRVQLISIDRLKREALKRNDHLKLAPNEPPAPNEVRPAAIPLDR